MEIIEGMEIFDLSLYLPNEKVLVLGDVHIGYEETLNKQGILIPRFQFENVMEKVSRIVRELDAETIVFNGDIKHEFGKISDTEWKQSLELLDFLIAASKKVIFVRGNHDKTLGPIALKREIEIVDYYSLDGVFICHGDQIFDNEEFRKAKTIVIGHEHPAVSLRKDGRTETFKCFLKGKYKRKNLIVMPSFNLVAEGSDVLRERLLSPFLKDISNFEVFIVADEIYNFGRIKDIKNL